MNKRKILSILSICLLAILLIMTSLPIYHTHPYNWHFHGRVVCQWEILIYELTSGSPFAVFDMLFLIAALVLSILSFTKKKQAKLFITLSVSFTWLAGTAIAGETLYLYFTIPVIILLICYAILCVPVLIWNIVLKNGTTVSSTQTNEQGKPKTGGGFFKGMSRSKNLKVYGDLEGAPTGLKSGRLAVSIEDGKCIAWLLGAQDVELSKKTVKSLELLKEHLPADIANRHIDDEADYYQITMTDGRTGTLRLICSTADEILELINSYLAETNEVGTTQDAKQLSPDSPIGKPLEWFSSDKGLEVYKAYTAPKNYLLQSRYMQEFKKMLAIEKADIDFDRHFLPHSYPDAKLPRTYFKALLESLGAEAVKNDIVRNYLLDNIMAVTVPYTIDEDGEPVPCDVTLSPTQVLSIDKNPLLYFVNNFNVFNFEQDDLGSLTEKFIIYMAAVKFILPLWGVGALNNVEEIRWLLDKDTYINEFGMLRKIKGFIKKCKELTDNTDYHKQLDIVLEQQLKLEEGKKE